MWNASPGASSASITIGSGSSSISGTGFGTTSGSLGASTTSDASGLRGRLLSASAPSRWVGTSTLPSRWSSTFVLHAVLDLAAAR